MPLQENGYESYNREDFDALLKDIEEISHSPELISPLRIASPPFTRISSTIHLSWIRQHLNAMIKERPPKNIMMMAMLHMAHFGHSSQWTIEEGIPTLMNESTVIITQSNQVRAGEIAHYVQRAWEAFFCGELKAKGGKGDGTNYFDPKLLLEWAENNRVPVDPDIAMAIREKRLGYIPPKQNRGWQSRPMETQRAYKAWQAEAEKLKQTNPSLSKNAIANKIAVTTVGGGKDAETIRKHIKI
jgi:hypothetical protein